MTTREVTYWALHVVSASLFACAMQSHALAVIGLMFTVAIGLGLSGMAIIGRGPMHNAPIIYRGAFASLVLLWLPAFIFAVAPTLQFNAVAFTILSVVLLTGVGGVMVCSPFLARSSR